MAQITLYLDDDTRSQLERAAKAAGLSQSRWLAQLIRERLASEWPAEVREMAGTWNDGEDSGQLEEQPPDAPREPF